MDTKPTTTANEEKNLTQVYHPGTPKESLKNQAFLRPPRPQRNPALSHDFCNISFLPFKVWHSKSSAVADPGVPKHSDLPDRAGSLVLPCHSSTYPCRTLHLPPLKPTANLWDWHLFWEGEEVRVPQAAQQDSAQPVHTGLGKGCWWLSPHAQDIQAHPELSPGSKSEGE